jgi:hypothetical protein
MPLPSTTIPHKIRTLLVKGNTHHARSRALATFQNGACSRLASAAARERQSQMGPLMGRPPLDRKAANTTRVQVLLPKSILKQIDAVAGENGRGKFIRLAISSLLKRRERKG